MAYTINQGYHEDRRLDWLQRGLLVGLPVLALILSIGAIIGHHNASTGSTTGHSPKLIPIISSLSGGTGTGTTGTSNNSGSSSLSGGSSSTGTHTGSLSSATGGGTAANSGSIAPVVGGRGGGPTGGTSGSTGSSGGSSGGTATTTTSCVNKLTGQASVCIFPYQTCTVPLSGITGYKTVDGTCIVVN